MKEHDDYFGIYEIYRSTNEPIDVDIVAVHGPNGGAVKTWTTDSEKICWLNNPEFLPKYVKRARVLVWGYNSHASSSVGKSTTSDQILQHAHTLVAQLYADRELENATDRPIIFLCHSLGGIIVKRALAYSASRTSSKLSHLHSMYTCTFAILFFGTPHAGSTKARLVGNLQKLAAIALPKGTAQVESSLLNAPEEDSDTLQSITDQFTPLMPRFRIFFFWEQEKTDLKYTKDYIVDQLSAAPMLNDTERSGIPADHKGMCKFAKNTDQGFRIAIAALRRYSKLAPEVIRARMATEDGILSDLRKFEAMELLRDDCNMGSPRTGCEPWSYDDFETERDAGKHFRRTESTIATRKRL